MGAWRKVETAAWLMHFSELFIGDSAEPRGERSSPVPATPVPRVRCKIQKRNHKYSMEWEGGWGFNKLVIGRARPHPNSHSRPGFSTIQTAKMYHHSDLLTKLKSQVPNEPSQQTAGGSATVRKGTGGDGQRQKKKHSKTARDC